MTWEMKVSTFVRQSFWSNIWLKKIKKKTLTS